MKIPPSFFPVVLAGGLMLCGAASAQTDSFTYQGRLERNGFPFSGIASMRLNVMDAATAGNSLAFTLGAFTVIDGEFTATFTAVPASVFNGNPRWIEISVDDPDTGGVTYVPLAPRQPVTATPYAMRANVAASVNGSVPASQITGTLPTSQLSGTINPSILASGTTVGTLTFMPAAGSPFIVANSNKVVSLNSDLLDGLDSTAFLQRSGGSMLNTTKVTSLNSDLLDGLDATSFLATSGGTMTGTLAVASPAVLDFGTSLGQKIRLSGGEVLGIGVQSSTLYQRTNANFAWYQGGSHVDIALFPGGGASLMTLSDSLLMLRPGVTNGGAQGPIRIGFGDVVSGDPYVWIGESDTDDQMELRANQINLMKRDGSGTSLNFGANTGQNLVLYQGGPDIYGIGVQAFNEYFRTGDSFAWYKDGVHSDTAGSPGAGGSTLMTLDATGLLGVQGIGNGLAVNNRNQPTKRWVMYSRDSGAVDELAFWSSTTGDVAALSPTGNLFLVGSLSTTVLTIRGGADIAEPFEMTEPEALEPGSVVVIDEEHPGKLKLSTEAFDTRVAGIISGAGGVKPGLRLHQDGVLEGDHHVALSGRVYVKADTSGGPIKPGDQLTTSINPGRAAKVTDYDRSHGAILGKAMSALTAGEGLVLVLVTLQ